MASRLDRLFVLLESGSSSSTRKTAANQLGEVVKVHPDELQHLLEKVFGLLSSPSWDTRIAAANAVEAIVKNMPEWNPRIGNKVEKQSFSLQFETFSLEEILANSSYLMADNVEEYFQNGNNEVSNDKNEVYNKQVGYINAAFGGSEILNISSIVSPDDVIGFSADRTIKTNRNPIEKVLKLEKRNCEQENAKRLKVEEPYDQWPLERFTEKLKCGLFSPKWTVRHGAGTALREILRLRGKNAGKCSDVSEQCMKEIHQKWLEDLAIRLICVLGLDRFGDYISDQVVAPVRETCAQCLGSLLNLMEPASVLEVITLLSRLLQTDEWDARHGGLLGLKYLLAVRRDMVNEVLPLVFPVILSKFGDSVDDVRGEAASALTPVCENIVQLMPEQAPNLIHQLWNMLLEEDDLSSICNNFMGLLGALFEIPQTKNLVSSDANTFKVLPRLWPFLAHNSHAVRKATLQTLSILISVLSEAVTHLEADFLRQALKNIFQRSVLETCPDVLNLVQQVWQDIVANCDSVLLAEVSASYFPFWLCMTMQPSVAPYDLSLLTIVNSDGTHIPVVNLQCWGGNNGNVYIGGDDTVPSEVREENVIQARCTAAHMLGYLACQLLTKQSSIGFQPPEPDIRQTLLFHLNSKSAMQRTVASLVIADCVHSFKSIKNLEYLKSLESRLNECISESFYFDEIAVPYTKLMQEVREYVSLLQKYCPASLASPVGNQVLTLDEILKLTKDNIAIENNVSKDIFEVLKEKQVHVHNTAVKIQGDLASLTVFTHGAVASALLSFVQVPEKLNLTIKHLMEVIKKEEREILQEKAAGRIAQLIDSCALCVPSPNAKIISNLCSLLCSNPEIASLIPSMPNEEKYLGIVSVLKQQKVSDRGTTRHKRTGSISIQGNLVADVTCNENGSDSNYLQKRGAMMALTKIVTLQEEHLPEKVPSLWNIVYNTIKSTRYPADFDSKSLQNDDVAANEIIKCLRVFETVCSHVHTKLLPQILSLLENLCHLLKHPYYGVRHMSSRCIGVLAKLDVGCVMAAVISHILPLLESSDVFSRQGAIESIYIVLAKHELDILPYVMVLVIPLLGRMSDQDESIRLLATHCFGTLVQLIPLDGVMPNPANFPSHLQSIIDEQRVFLSQLLNPNLIPDHQIPPGIKTQLRSYQQCGVNWLAFLNTYKLHGILCDDMGLGKTLQSLCILASSHSSHQKLQQKPEPSSLVVCPPTLSSHWLYEIQKFIPDNLLRPLQYEGTPTERDRLRSELSNYNVILSSYDIVKKDLEFLADINWNYCILDEGHIIKNGKTKISKAVKQIKANHRLILSGTPIQNSVLELWSLFDFLMPGFLGTEKQFNLKYSKPILTSRDPKCSAREQEAGILAMESLHHQVLPFILRRMKEDVLKDLPPKITQDYYCDLSSLQQLLYEDFSKTEAVQVITSSAKYQNKFNVFQALRYLQSVCNHPKLVLTKNHPLYETVFQKLSAEKSDLSDIKHAAKLQALKQLLFDLGIGITNDADSSSCDVISQHRALIFCQLKCTLDILETDLFKAHMPHLTYLRLDGNVPLSERQNIVNRFNNDPSIDVLILTTHIGGLGLNLTGADTIIFVEHDWSPMKDLQAMDRAHRIGQKKVVNVYRLITKSTLEEKIMGYQKFKLLTANRVINSENSTLFSMHTDKMLDLFTLSRTSNFRCDADSATPLTNSDTNSVLKSLPDLWDDKDYEEEYDLSTFVKNLRNSA